MIHDTRWYTMTLERRHTTTRHKRKSYHSLHGGISSLGFMEAVHQWQWQKPAVVKYIIWGKNNNSVWVNHGVPHSSPAYILAWDSVSSLGTLTTSPRPPQHWVPTACVFSRICRTHAYELVTSRDWRPNRQCILRALKTPRHRHNTESQLQAILQW